MAPSIYDDSFLTEKEKKAIEDFQAAYRDAQARGDREGMDAAHAAAERVRAGHGYSGGADGFGYVELDGGTPAGYSPARLRSYVPQTEAVDRVYDAARDAKIAGLKSAYDSSVGALRAQREAVPEVYRAERNDLAAQAELSGRNFNEYAAASGLNSGTAGQAQLARSNTLQAGLAKLGRQEAQEITDIQRAEAELKLKFENDIAQAVAEGEYKRADALLEEYRRAAQSAVSTDKAQAEENYKAWSSGR